VTMSNSNIVMCWKALILLYLLVGISKAQNASVKVVTNISSYLCTDQYLVVGEDTVTCAWELSGNNSVYTYNEFDRPRIRMRTFTVLHDGSLQLLNDALPCTPFDSPKNGFCNKVNRYNPACSCEVVGPHVYRVKYVHTLKDVSESRGRFILLWPSLKLTGHIEKVCYIPEVKAEPEIEVFQIKPSFNCARRYQVVGEDFTILELDVSGNSSRYSFKKGVWPRFEYKTQINGKLSQPMPLCTPFAEPINGFCVTKHSFPNGCSCENVGVDRYRLRANVTATSTRMSDAIIFLTWPGKYGPKQYNYSLPEIKMKPMTDLKRCRPKTLKYSRNRGTVAASFWREKCRYIERCSNQSPTPASKEQEKHLGISSRSVTVKDKRVRSALAL
ncbi:nuclease harbi1, partial [Plakobranchus ocellatus]